MLETLIQVTKLFDDNQIEYCLIGGLAMMLHHGRANTVDIDFYVLVDDLDQVKKILQKEKYEVRTAGEFQLKAKVNRVQIDLLYADHYMGAGVVKRAIPRQLGHDIVQVATPEDLIILKTVADRSIDRRDIAELRELFQGKLDEAYIHKNLDRLNKKLSE